jgi:hypothetical protein
VIEGGAELAEHEAELEVGDDEGGGEDFEAEDTLLGGVA